MSKPQMRELAKDMAAYAARIVQGDTTKEATWLRALDAIGCRVEPFNNRTGKIAWYAPVFDQMREYPCGVVGYNTAYPLSTRAKGLAHEFGHALLQMWVPCFVFDADVVYSYHDDPAEVRHQIARMFEKLMVG